MIDTQESAILFQAEDKIFLLDIPYSIAIAQGNIAPCKQLEPTTAEPSLKTQENKSQRKQLLSCSPAKEPFPSTEPKKPNARAKVLESTPISERRFHSELILPLVRDSLETIRAGIDGDRWCFTRVVPCEEVNEYMVPDQPPSRKRRKGNDSTFLQPGPDGHAKVLDKPPVILSSAVPNIFETLSELNVTKNPSPEAAVIQIGTSHETTGEYLVPPESSFILCELPIFKGPDYRAAHELPIPGLSQKFNLILMDPPWPNRSVRRSGHYTTNHYSEMDILTEGMREILQAYSYRHEDMTQLAEPQGGSQIQSQQSIAAIWITNAEKSRKAAYHAMSGAGFHVCEEWVWVKTTQHGQPISALDGLWRKPYEILVIGKRELNVDALSSAHETHDLTAVSEAIATRRVIAAVPDLHSRKPNLRSIFEKIFFSSGSSHESYTALEVFARNLTAGWWACGNEALKFNARECWVDDTTKNWIPE